MWLCVWFLLHLSVSHPREEKYGVWPSKHTTHVTIYPGEWPWKFWAGKYGCKFPKHKTNLLFNVAIYIFRYFTSCCVTAYASFTSLNILSTLNTTQKGESSNDAAEKSAIVSDVAVQQIRYRKTFHLTFDSLTQILSVFLTLHPIIKI